MTTRKYTGKRKPRRKYVKRSPKWKFGLNTGGSIGYKNFRIGGFLGAEIKFYDTGVAGLAITSPTDASGAEMNPSATITLNSVTQGDGESQRDGRRLTMLSLFVNGSITCNVQTNVTVPDNPSICYVAIVLDTQANGTALNSEDVYINPSGSAQLASSPLRNLQYSKRFKVLKTIRRKMPPPTLTWDGTNMEQSGQIVQFNCFIPLHGMIVNFTGTTETVANIVDNALHVIAFSNNIGMVPQLNYNARLRFRG